MSRVDSLTHLAKEDLIRLNPEVVASRLLDKEELEAAMEAFNCFWLHYYQPHETAPHAELTSGKCSNGFINLRPMLCRMNWCQILAGQLIQLLAEHCAGRVDWVIGSDSAALDLAHEVARQLSACHYPMQKGPDKTQLWENMQVPADSRVLQVEELMTTAGTAKAVRQGFCQGNKAKVEFIPLLPVVVDRRAPGDNGEINCSRVIYLVRYEISVWEPKDCPLCQAGSRRLRPAANWSELTSQAG